MSDDSPYRPDTVITPAMVAAATVREKISLLAQHTPLRASCRHVGVSAVAEQWGTSPSIIRKALRAQGTVSHARRPDAP